MKIPHFTNQDYGDLLALLDEGHDFPRTYGEWITLTKVVGHGKEVNMDLTINPNDFVKWCSRQNPPTPTVAALLDYTNLPKGKRLVSENTTTFE